MAVTFVISLSSMHTISAVAELLVFTDVLMIVRTVVQF